MSGRIKRILSLSLCLILILTVNVPAGGPDTAGFKLTSEENEYLNSLRTRPIVLSYSYDLAHIDFDGKPHGLLDPVADILQNELGLTVEFVKTPWNQALTQMENGDIDFYGPIALSDERIQNYNTVDLLYRSQSHIVTRVDNLIHSMPGLHNRTIGLLEGAVISQAMRVYLGPSGEIIYFPNISSMLGSLRAGEIDAFATANDIELEVLRHEDIQFEFPIENFSVEKGLISGREDMQMLSSILSRYLAENPNNHESISELRQRALMHFMREQLNMEIDYLQSNYDEVSMYSDSTFYPLLYLQKSELKGMQLEINKVFEQLTGINVRIVTDMDVSHGIEHALEKIKYGEYMALVGGYYDTATWSDPDIEYSPNMWLETIRTYSYKDTDENLMGKTLGTTRFTWDYLGWSNVTGNTPVLYNSHPDLINALKLNKVDAVFMGEMNFNYGYTILKDYELREIMGITAEATTHMLYGKQNEEFNAAFNASIMLYQLLSPQSKSKWKNSIDKYKADYILMRHWQQIWMTAAIAVISIMAAALIYLLRRDRLSLKQVISDNVILRNKVHRDALTGIYNRRYMDENLKRIIKSAVRSGATVSVMMIDIDYFKKYNDTYGHSAGDACLKVVAKALSSSIAREEDFVARYGGEEFAVVLPSTDEKGARVLADRLLDNVRQLEIPHEKNDVAAYVTVSIGVTTGTAMNGLTGADYIKRADEALYASKLDGRNRYTFIDL